jgi:hypothetical protein
MEVSKSPGQGAMISSRRLIARLSRFQFAFPLLSAGYCLIHWLAAHNFSSYVFGGALIFGAIAAMAVGWLSNLAQEGGGR